MKHAPSHRSRGTTVVEFAIVAATLLITLFIVIDLSRLVYLRVILEEGVRRGARLAAVCPVSADTQSLPARATIFADPAAAGAATPGAVAANVVIEYLDASGSVLAQPAQSVSSIRFVRVSLVGISVPLLVPFISQNFAPTNISATTLAESLGVSPTAVTPC